MNADQSSGRSRERVRGYSVHLRNILIVVAIGVFVSQWIRVILRPQGDFALHWLFGERFRTGEYLYGGNMHVPYPPFWALACTPLTLLPMPTMRALLYPFGILPLALLLWILRDLTRQHFRINGPRLFWATALSLLLSSRFLIRELPDNGINLALVALTWTAIWLWVHHRDRTGGICLGFAIALKCTPALFVAYFAWKREWRIVLWSVIASIAFTLTPAVWMGRTDYTTHMEAWISRCARGISEPNPLIGVLGEEEVKNVSLRPGLARFLMRLPDGHKGLIHHPLRFEMLDLSPRNAGIVVKVLMFGLIATIAWTFRHRVRSRGDSTLLWECAAISVLLLLYSPITWRQHCVGVIPAFYLLAHTAFKRNGLPRSAASLLGVYTLLVLVLDRGIIGRDLTLLLDGYSVTTWSLLALLVAIQICRSVDIQDSFAIDHACPSTPRFWHSRNPFAPNGTGADGKVPPARSNAMNIANPLERTFR